MGAYSGGCSEFRLWFIRLITASVTIVVLMMVIIIMVGLAVDDGHHSGGPAPVIVV